MKIVNYYDLHAHVLPGIDDGPKHMPKSVDIARVAGHEHFATILGYMHTADDRAHKAVAGLGQLVTN